MEVAIENRDADGDAKVQDAPCEMQIDLRSDVQGVWGMGDDGSGLGGLLWSTFGNTC